MDNDSYLTAVELVSKIRGELRSSGVPVMAQLVANGVRGDSRVIKSARAAMDLGFATILLGITVEDTPESLVIDGVPVILVPLRAKTSMREMAKQWGRRTQAIRALRIARRVRNQALGRSGPAARQSEPAMPPWSKSRQKTLHINVGFVEVLEALQPSIIHVHDTAPLPSAIAYASPRKLSGKNTQVIYDSHECNPKLAKSYPDVTTFTAALEIEKRYIRDADQVITVSDEIAELLKRTYHLQERPLVVTNSPTAVISDSDVDVRRAVGLAEGVPLAVYSGWIDKERGLDTMVRALADVPELHLAIVCNPAKPAVARVVRLARVLGVEERIHLAPYVLPSEVTKYLSSADIGLIPRKAGGHLDLSLPTKYREYLHARLPLVVSTNKAMADAVEATGVGEVFTASRPLELVTALTSVMADPQRYRDAITPELLHLHSWEAQAEVLGQLYLRIAPKPPRTTSASIDLVEQLRTLSSDRFHEESESLTSFGDWSLAGHALAIGKANSAGQGYQWAEAAKREFGILAASYGPRRLTSHKPHRVAPKDPTNLDQAAASLAWMIDNHTHVMVDGYRDLFGSLFHENLPDEISFLRSHGLRIALVAHGSEVRDPDGHLAWFPESFFSYVDPDWRELLRSIAEKNRRIAAEFDGPLFVSTPDLRNDLPGATWLPVTIDIKDWAAIPDVPERAVPRVLHRPSHLRPVKGTETIVPVLQKLHDRGVIEYLPDTGLIAADAMRDQVAACDILVDQIRTGSYGVAACEGMAAGRVVVGNLHPDVRSFVEDEIPIVDAPPEDLEAVIVALAEDPQRRAAIAAAGRKYATTWHSGKAAAHAMADFLKS